jgi:phosphomannomutase/phosphoglucomutase
VNVIDLGQVTTPMTYFAAFHLNAGGALMVTGSHNPPDYNGIKMVLAGETLHGESIQKLRQRIESKDFANGVGSYRAHDISSDYQARIVSDVRLKRPMKIIVDAGNGIAGAYAPALYRAMGCEVREMFCEVDGQFPNHHPDPSVPGNLAALIACLKNSDSELGLAFDGDGDRLGVVTKDGSIIFPDRQLMLFAADMLTRNPGALVIFDVKSTRNLCAWVRSHGGEPLVWKTGHSLLKAKMMETGALLAGEMSGHVCFKERWYGFDDGLYTGARLLEILSDHANPSAVLNTLPDSLNTPELQIRMSEGEPHRLIEHLRQTATFDGASQVLDIDGLRVEYPDGFGLLRASNTTPVIVLRFEADNAEAMSRIQGEFRRLLQEATPQTTLPF